MHHPARHAQVHIQRHLITDRFPSFDRVNIWQVQLAWHASNHIAALAIRCVVTKWHMLSEQPATTCQSTSWCLFTRNNDRPRFGSLYASKHLASACQPDLLCMSCCSCSQPLLEASLNSAIPNTPTFRPIVRATKSNDASSFEFGGWQHTRNPSLLRSERNMRIV